MQLRHEHTTPDTIIHIKAIHKYSEKKNSLTCNFDFEALEAIWRLHKKHLRRFPSLPEPPSLEVSTNELPLSLLEAILAFKTYFWKRCLKKGDSHNVQ